MDCTLDWTLSTDEWDSYFAAAPRPSLLQSRHYGEAIAPIQGQKTRNGLVRLFDRPAALIQIQEASLLGRTIHALIMDRGPVWLDAMPSAENARQVFETLDRTFPARPLRRRRIIPEISHKQTEPVFSGLRFNQRSSEGYRTIWLDLRADIDRLRSRLRPKWRNMLAKAERKDLTLEWGWTGRALGPFLAHYGRDKRKKGYRGATPDTLRALASRFGTETGILMTYYKDQPASGLLLFRHGRAATWQAGWVTQVGRDTAANHVALWQAMLTLKDAGIDWLDLGGIPDDAPGLARFKGGMGGHDTTLAGPYG